MLKTVHRKLVFSAEEVRDALFDVLHRKDHPVPKDYATAEISLNSNGAMIQWAEQSEQ